MNPNIIGALINSALYLLCVFVAGIVTGHPVAWKLALVALGVTYISHIAQIGPLVSRDWCMGIVVLSVALGATAGVDLLF